MSFFRERNKRMSFLEREREFFRERKLRLMILLRGLMVNVSRVRLEARGLPMEERERERVCVFQVERERV